jgi:two-component system sensor histidine kinase KdpD
MTDEKRLLRALVVISNISNDGRLGFGEKLERIILEVVSCIQAERGSIMLLKGKKSLEVVASTKPELIGVKQPLDEDSPSCRVVKNRAPLYLDRRTGDHNIRKRFHHYKKHALLTVPIISKDKVIGVLNVTEKIGADMFEKEEQEMVLNIAGQVIGALENQRLTESLKKSRQILEKKNLQLEKLEKLRTDLFNMLIHDLKGPISELVANLDILSYTVSDKNRQYVESAQTGCETLYTMVSNLLDIARFEEGRLELIYEKIDPPDLINEALGRLFGLCKQKQLTFVKKCPLSGPDALFGGDRGILLRVLQNLLSNAIQYSPPGETIEIGFQHLTPQKIEFFVEDHGPGVPAESQEAIFDKYTQLEKKADGRMYTTGLGLTFCKMAIEAHGGKIGVHSQGGNGSRFYFTIGIKRLASN